MRSFGKRALLCLLCLLLLGGCSAPGLELKNRLIVQAIGVDRIKDGVRVTLQVLNTEMAGNPNNGSDLGDATRTLTSEGPTVSEAIAALSVQSGKQPLLSQNKLLVFGRETAEQGLFPLLDYFVRDPSSRLTVPVVLSDTTAEALVGVSLGENVLSSDAITELLGGEPYAPAVVSQALYAWMNRAQSDVTDAFLPVLGVREQGGEQSLLYQGVEVFSGDRLAYALSFEETAALSLLTGRMDGGYWTVPGPGTADETTMHIRKARSRVQSRIENGAAVFEIHIKLTADVAETKAQSPFPLDKAYLQEVQSRLQQSVANKVQAAVRSCFLEKSSDPFGLGHRLRQRHPRQFSAQFPSWRDALARAQVTVSVSVKLERIGNGVENL